MDCREVRGALSALIDNELSPGSAAAVRAHLDQCPACRRIALAYTQDDRVLRQFVRSAPYLPVANDVRRRIRSEHARTGIWPVLAKGGYGVATAMAMVALVALIAVSGLALRDMSSRNGDRPIAATGPAGTTEVFLAEPSPTVEPEQAELQGTGLPTPDVTAEPTPTALAPTPSVPAPAPVIPTPEPASLLPKDLYFLAELSGRAALWFQPADGAEPVVIASDSSQSVTWFTLLPGTGQIAYTLSAADDESNPPVHLVDMRGGESSLATAPDGQHVAELVISPDGRQVATVSLDRSTLSVGMNGESYQPLFEVEIPEVEGIHRVQWSPNGERLLFKLSRISSPDRPTVLDVASGDTVWQGTQDVLDMIWDLDSDGLLYSAYSSILRLDLKAGEVTNVTPDAVGTPSGVARLQVLSNLAWLPDGRISFTLHADDTVYSNADLWLMHADGSDAWRAVRDLGPVNDVTWVYGQYGFVVGTIASDQIATQPTLRYYATHNTEPVTLGAGVDSRVFGPSEWSAEP